MEMRRPKQLEGCETPAQRRASTRPEHRDIAAASTFCNVLEFLSRNCFFLLGAAVQKQAKFGIGIGIIVVSLGFLAWLGYGESKTYYHTIAELQTLHGTARAHRIRVGGTVEPGTIKRLSGAWNLFWPEKGSCYP